MKTNHLKLPPAWQRWWLGKIESLIAAGMPREIARNVADFEAPERARIARYVGFAAAARGVFRRLPGEDGGIFLEIDPLDVPQGRRAAAVRELGGTFVIA